MAALALSARTGDSAVWTGSKMIVWGGHESQSYVRLNSGGARLSKRDPTSERRNP